MSSSDGYDPATNKWTIHGVVFTDEFFKAFTTEMPSPDIYFRVTRIDEHGQPLITRRYYTLPAEPLQPVKISRKPWLNRLLRLPYFFWRNYQSIGSTSRRDRLIAAIRITWLMIRPDWMKRRLMFSAYLPHGYSSLQEWLLAPPSYVPGRYNHKNTAPDSSLQRPRRWGQPSCSYGGSMRLDEGPTVRSGFGPGPSTPKPAMAPRGQGVPVKPSFPPPRKIREDIV